MGVMISALYFIRTALWLFIRTQLRRLRPNLLLLCLLLKICLSPGFNHPEVLYSHSPRGVSLLWKEEEMAARREEGREGCQPPLLLGLHAPVMYMTSACH